MVPMLGASGAIAAVLGAYWVLYPDARILTLVVCSSSTCRASIFLGLWFLYQLARGALRADLGGLVELGWHGDLRPYRRLRARA